MTLTTRKVSWIAVDWGTTHLRLWLYAADGTVITSLSSEKGAGTLEPREFEAALLELISDVALSESPTEVVCCGMVGSVSGWAHAPYRTAPCRPLDVTRAIRVAASNANLSITILPGINQRQPSDVMRGEETQIAGYLASEPDYDGILCLPGTHAKWARLKGGMIETFKTFPTGELFSLLSTHSTLSHGMSSTAWDDESFVQGVTCAIDAPDAVLAELFPLRARALCEQVPAGVARARLSGLLIGWELSNARPYWHSYQVGLIGASELVTLYAKALVLQGVKVQIREASALTRAGLEAAHRDLENRAA